MEYKPNHDQELPRDFDNVDFLEARIDTEILELYGELEEFLPDLAESDDVEYLRTVILAFIRAAYAKAAEEVGSNPQLLSELHQILNMPHSER